MTAKVNEGLGVEGQGEKQEKTKSTEEILGEFSPQQTLGESTGRSGTARELGAMLDRAGVTRGGAVSDSGPVRGTDTAAAAHASRTAQLTGTDATATAHAATAEAPVGAPPIPAVQFSDDTKIGAESFAINIEQTVNDVFLKNGAEGQTSPLNFEGKPLGDVVNDMFFGGRVGQGATDKTEIDALEAAVSGFAAQVKAEAPPAAAKTATPQAATATPANQVTRGQTPTNVAGRPAPDEIKITPETMKMAEEMFDKITGSAKINPKMTLGDFTRPDFLAALIKAAENHPNVGKLGTKGLPGIDQKDIRSIANLTADSLMAMFMKLNINDPNNSIDTHNELHRLGTELRQQGLKEGQGKAEAALRAAAEAQQYGADAQKIGTVVQVVVIIIAIVLIVVSFGTATGPALALAIAVFVAAQGIMQTIMAIIQLVVAFIVNLIVNIVVQLATALVTALAGALAAAGATAAASAAMIAVQAAQAMFTATLSAAMQAILQLVGALITLVLNVLNAGVQHTAAQKTSTASEKKNDVERFRLTAEKEQAVIEEENAIVQVIMESKNQIVEAVMKMMNAMFATQNKVMSSTMSR